MSNYTKTTDFEAKDSLPSGDSGKIIRGSEFETEFDNIATAIASKSDANNPTFTGTVTIDGLTVNGNTVLGNAATDTVTVTADIASNLLPSADDTYNLGAVGAEWNDLHVDGVAYIDTINGFAATGNVDFGDSNIARFGAGNDLQIYHDGSNSYIEDAGAGSLFIRGTSLILEDAGGNDYIAMTDTGTGGTVEIKHNAATKLATTSTGIDVTGGINVGTITSTGDLSLATDNATAYFGAGLDLRIFHDGSNGFIKSTGTSDLNVQTDSKQRIKVADNGDISFYEDTGTTAKLLWDASAESLGLGTSSPSRKLTVQGGSGDTLPARIIGGSGTTTSGLEFQDPSTTADYKVQIGSKGDELYLRAGGGERLLIDSSGNVGIGSTGRIMSGYDGNSKTLTVYDSDGSAQSGYLELASLANNNGYNAGAITFVNNANSNNSSPESANSKTVATIRAETVTSDNNAGDDAGASLTILTKPEAGGLTERMRIDSSGNVGIGTNSPNRQLSVNDYSGNGTLSINAASGGASTMYFADGATGTDVYTGFIQYSHSNNAMQFATNGGAERMRITSDGSCRWTPDGTNQDMTLTASGNLLVGTTSVSNSGKVTIDAGANASGLYAVTDASAGYAAAVFERSASDGDIAVFKKGGVSVGSIGVSSFDLTIQSSASGHNGLRFGDAWIAPIATNQALDDGTTDLGLSGARFKDLYLSGGVVFGTTGGNVTGATLDDYEEGTWTPVYSTTGTDFTSVTMDVSSATYTKIGNTVILRAYIRTDDVDNTGATGSITITGLPFAASESSAVSITYAQGWNSGGHPSGGYISSSSIFLQERATSDGATGGLPVSSLKNGTVANQNNAVLLAAYKTTA